MTSSWRDGLAFCALDVDDIKCLSKELDPIIRELECTLSLLHTPLELLFDAGFLVDPLERDDDDAPAPDETSAADGDSQRRIVPWRRRLDARLSGRSNRASARQPCERRGQRSQASRCPTSPSCSRRTPRRRRKCGAAPHRSP